MTTGDKPKIYVTAIVPAQPAPIATTTELETSIDGFNAPLAGFLGSLGLPTEEVLVDFAERRFVLQALQKTLDVLSYEERAKAFYLTKFSVSVMVGLFDAALNFLWDETILALRRLAVGIDLSYFFDTAEKRESHRARLQNEEDLKLLDDFTLIDTCARVGLLTDVNRERLRHVNYMRNHASAAHPNQSELNGQEMVAWLSNCLRYAITAKPDHAVVATKQLLANIRSTLIPEKDIPVIASDFQKFTIETCGRSSVDPLRYLRRSSQKADCRTNIARLAPHVWSLSSEDRKFQVGARHEHYIKQADQQRKAFADEFLVHVGGQQYRAEDVLVGELLDKLRNLNAAHNAMNNFYNEWPHAKSLASSLPISGVVPRAARLEWVKDVDTTADGHYRHYIAGYGEAEVVQFLRLFEDPDFTVDFDWPKAHRRAQDLAKTLQDKTKNVHVLRALDVLLQQPEGTLRKLSSVAKFREAIKNLPKSTV